MLKFTERLAFIPLLLLFPLLFLLGATTPAQASSVCEPLLEASLKKAFWGITPDFKSFTNHAGLPIKNIAANHYDVSNQLGLSHRFKEWGWPAGQVDRFLGTLIMVSDLGPTSWETPQELQDWYLLDRFTSDANLASEELSFILQTPGYCTAGLLPWLCEGLRRNRQRPANLQMMSSHLPGRGRPQQEIDDSHATAVEVNRLKQLGRLLFFPKRKDLSQFPNQFTKSEAQKIFSTLTRETLIRHLMFLGVDGNVHRGLDLELNTGLAMSSAPVLVQLIRYLVTFPIVLPGNFEFRYPLDEATLLIYGWPQRSVERRTPIIMVNVGVRDNSIDPPVASFWFDPVEGKLDSLALLQFRLETLDRLQDTLARFKLAVGITAQTQVLAEWELDEDLIVKLHGLNSYSQILFYYFLANETKNVNI